MPPTAWMISNRQPYGEEIDAPDSLLLAGPQLLGRFTTTPLANKRRGRGGGGGGDAALAAAGAAAGSCSITRLGPGACVETAEATERIKRHLEVVLDRRIQMLVADFTRDDRDRLWFLQASKIAVESCSARRGRLVLHKQAPPVSGFGTTFACSAASHCIGRAKHTQTRPTKRLFGPDPILSTIVAYRPKILLTIDSKTQPNTKSGVAHIRRCRHPPPPPPDGFLTLSCRVHALCLHTPSRSKHSVSWAARLADLSD